MIRDYAEIVDRHGRRRRARKGDVLGDGEHWSIPMTFQDEHLPEHADGGGATQARVIDARGELAGRRPGFAFIDDVSRDASQDLHEQRKRDLASRWKRNKKKRAPQPQAGRWGKGGTFSVPRPGDGVDDSDDEDVDLTTLTLDELQARADQARAARDQRLANGWRNR